MPRVSVIIPVYGVEKYIERCARSLFCQTMVDVEFIFVDDCTQDSSIEILKNVIDCYPEREVQIIRHEHNKGLPLARQTGLALASGDFIIHCDSDDWVEPDYCQKMYDAAISNDADMVVCRYYLDDGVDHKTGTGYDDVILSKKEEALGAAISLKSSPYLWNKMVKRSIYDENLIYPEHFLAEDWVLSVQFAYLAKRIVTINDFLYHYFCNPNSTLRINSKEVCLKRAQDECANVQSVVNHLKDLGLEKRYRKEIVKRMFVTKLQLYPVVQYPDCRKVWRNTFNEANFEIIFNNLVPYIHRRKHVFLLLGLYPLVHKIFDRFTNRP